MADQILAPWLVPEDERVRIADENTVVFRPAFARGNMQAASYGDPRLIVERRYKGLSGEERANLLAFLWRIKGKYNKFYAPCNFPLRGSFPATEMASNNTFNNGTTGWSSASQFTLSVADRMLRVLWNEMVSAGALLYPSSALTLTANIPYLLRAFLLQGRGSNLVALRAGISAPGTEYGQESDYTEVYGLRKFAFVPYQASSNVTIAGILPSSDVAGNFLSIPWVSVTQCALADGRENSVTYSDQFDNAAWTKTRCSISANASTAPDYTSTADSLVEDTSTNTHYMEQAATVSSSSLDYTAHFMVKANGRNYCAVSLVEQTGGTTAYQYFNLSTGAVGANGSTGANWANRRAYITSMGDGWYRCTLVARKTNAATDVRARLWVASADGTVSYTGSGAAALLVWRGGLAQSGVPVDHAQTTSAAVTAAAQTGNTLYVKGLPASTSGLLLQGDVVGVNNELRVVAQPLDSDGLGLGYLMLEPDAVTAVAGGTPVVIGTPLGQFRLSDDAEYENLLGAYADLTLRMEAVYP